MLLLYIVSKAKQNAKEIWRNIRKITGYDRSCEQMKKLQIGEKVICESRDMITALNKYFVHSVKSLAQTQSSQQQILIPKLVNAATPVFYMCSIPDSI